MRRSEAAEEAALTRRFAHFVCIDWSGAAVERPPGIAMASCDTGTAAPVLLRPARGWSRQAVLDWLIAHGGAGTDMLIGIDFSPSLPFADCGAFFPGWVDTPATARELWGFVDAVAAGDPHLGAGSFVDHREASRHFRRHGNRTGDLFGNGIGRLRETERACRAAGLGLAQSCFNLVGAAQVGKSSLTGMRVLHRLGGGVPIWPFDPVPERGPLLVEIYTTIAARAAGVRGGSKLRDGTMLDRALAPLGSTPHASLVRYDDHSTDAILTAAWLRHVADEETLWRPAALTPILAATEGWTFGVP